MAVALREQEYVAIHMSYFMLTYSVYHYILGKVYTLTRNNILVTCRDCCKYTVV